MVQWLDDFPGFLWLLPPLMGAIIGYITNWLAIKMLFRPYKKWYIGKLPIPFTPGLLPTRRGEIANKVGAVISEQLINEQEIKRTISDTDVRTAIAKILQDYWEGIERKEQALYQVFENFLEPKKIESFSLSISSFLSNQLLQWKNSQLEQSILEYIARELSLILQRKPEQENLEALMDRIIPRIGMSISKQGQPLELQRYRQRYEQMLAQWETEQKTLNSLLDKARLETWAEYLKSHPEYLNSLLIGLLNHEDLLLQLMPILQKLMNQHWSLSLIASFLSPERLRSMLQTSITEARTWLADPEHQVELNNKVVDWLLLQCDQPMQKWGFSQEGIFKTEAVMQWFEQIILWFSSENQMQMLRQWGRHLVEKLTKRSYQVMLESIQIPCETTSIAGFLKLHWHDWLDFQQKKDNIEAFIQRIMDRLLRYPLVPFLGGAHPDEDDFTRMAHELQSVLTKAIPAGLDLLDVSKMVERKLNEFPLGELEKLTLAVAGRELKAITWVGAILGFLIGSLQLMI